MSISLMTQMGIPFLARLTNQTSTSFSKIPTITRPNSLTDSATSQQVIDLANLGGALTQNILSVTPFAVGSNNQTMSVRVYAWHKRNDGKLWTPKLLCGVQGTLSSTFPGIAGENPSTTGLYCDTIIPVIPAAADGSFRIVSPGTVTADSGIAHFNVDIEGAQIVEVVFITDGSSTSCNAELILY